MKIIFEGTEAEKKEFLNALRYADRAFAALIQEYLEDNNFELEEKATKYRKLFQELKKDI